MRTIFRDALITALKMQALLTVSTLVAFLSALVVVWLSGVVWGGSY